MSEHNMIYFKNEILTDINKLENNMNKRITQLNNLLKSNIEENSAKFTKMSSAISELIEIVSDRKNDNEKREELLEMKNKIWNHINENKNKILTLTKDIKDSIFKYDRLIIDNLELPGIVGAKSKFKNMKDLFQYIYYEVVSEKTFREQQNLGNQKYKEKVEGLINTLQLRANEIYKVSNEICTNKLKDFEIMMNTRCETTENLVEKMRVENSEYATELKNKIEGINIDYNKLEQLKSDIDIIINNELKKFRKEVDKNNNSFNEYKNEFNLIKEKFTQLSEFIRDIRFQKNLTSSKRVSIFNKESRNIDFRKKQINKNINDDAKTVKNDSRENTFISFVDCESNDFDDKKDNNSMYNRNFNYSEKRVIKSKILDKMKQNHEITFEINKLIKNNNNDKLLVTNEIELNYVIEKDTSSICSSTLSDKNEISPKTERLDHEVKTFNFINSINSINKIIIDKNNKIDNNKEIKPKKESNKILKLQSVELMAIESKKNNNILKSKESNPKFIRNYKSYKTDCIINLKQNAFFYPKLNNNINSNKKINKLLLTDVLNNNKESSLSNNENDNEKNEKVYPIGRRYSSIGKKIPFLPKDNEFQIATNKKLNIIDINSKKNNDNINNLNTKVDSMENKYLYLLNKINDLFNKIKNINIKIAETNISISKLKIKENKNNENSSNDFKLFLNKTLKGNSHALSVILKQHKKRNSNIKIDKLDTSNKLKLPNDEANIILRKIEPYLIKEFKKKK